VRKFKLIEDDFSFGGGELTPTMKLKRKVTAKKFQREIDEIYAV
jgi:long-subunit acyl-CoA synthetase (AMP-forming)